MIELKKVQLVEVGKLKSPVPVNDLMKKQVKQVKKQKSMMEAEVVLKDLRGKSLQG